MGDDYAGEIPQKIKSAEIRLEFMNEWMPRKLRDADGLTGSVYINYLPPISGLNFQLGGLTAPFRWVSSPKPMWQRQKPKIQFRGDRLILFYGLSSTPLNPLK